MRAAGDEVTCKLVVLVMARIDHDYEAKTAESNGHVKASKVCARRDG